MTARTVLDVARDGYVTLGVDPDMPFDQFQRWLRYGKNADEMKRWPEAPPPFDRHVSYRALGYNECLDAIKDGDEDRDDDGGNVEQV